MAATYTILDDAAGDPRRPAAAVRARILKPGARGGLLPPPAGPRRCPALPKAHANPTPAHYGVMQLPQGTGTRTGATQR